MHILHSFPTLLILAFLSPVYATIYWDDCSSESTHPGIPEGNLYNLCIDQHLFEGERHSWQFTEAEIRNSAFKDCYFTNERNSPNNFTHASWTNVDFDNCVFGSIDPYGPEIIFDKTSLTNVVFRNTVFDHSITLVFREFLFNNVTFIGCTFKGDTLFTLGQINTVNIIDSHARYSDSSYITSGNDSFTFRQVTIATMQTLRSEFVSPVRFQSADVALMSINETAIANFHCHGGETEDGWYSMLSSFNASFFQTVEFREEVFCAGTTWRGLFMNDVSFKGNADFSNSLINDIEVDGLSSNTTTGDCRTLDFSNSFINGGIIANVSIDCIGDFENVAFTTVFVRNLFAVRPNFKGAVFSMQEFIDGQCCSTSCVSLGCLCNVTHPSGNCPAGSRAVNLTALESGSCFPSGAQLRRRDGSVVPMTELVHGDRVATGSGMWSDIYFFGHRNAAIIGEFVEVRHRGVARPLRVSAGHYVYANGVMMTAGSLKIGDQLLLHSGETSEVTELNTVRDRGLFAPTSVHGDLVVDGVVVSSYTSEVDPDVAHGLLAPLRGMYRMGWRRTVSWVGVLHEWSWAPVARWLRLPRGPEVVGL